MVTNVIKAIDFKSEFTFVLRGCLEIVVASERGPYKQYPNRDVVNQSHLFKIYGQI